MEAEDQLRVARHRVSRNREAKSVRREAIGAGRDASAATRGSEVHGSRFTQLLGQHEVQSRGFQIGAHQLDVDAIAQAETLTGTLTGELVTCGIEVIIV